jgi:hypothetical protein
MKAMELKTEEDPDFHKYTVIYWQMLVTLQQCDLLEPHIQSLVGSSLGNPYDSSGAEE